VTPVNPVLGATEAFLAVFNNLPVAVRFFVSLALFLFAILCTISLIFRFRG